MLHEAILALGGHPGVLFADGEETTAFKHLHPSERVLLDRIKRVASNFLYLKKFIELNSCAQNITATDNFSSSGPGGYMHAFCNALHEVLLPYREDILLLEKEILNDPSLSLSYITYCAEKHALFLSVLNQMIKQLILEDLHGCQILGFLKRQLASGIDEIKDAIRKILFSCHKFFYKQLTCWLLYGHLIDKHKEFFIQHFKDINSVSQLRSDSNTYVNGSTSVTDAIAENRSLYPAFCEYELEFLMLPYYIPVSVAYKILFIGQTILMFSNDPDDKSNVSSQKHKGSSFIWGKREEEFLNKLQTLECLAEFDLDKFELTMDEIRTCVTEHLWHVAVEKAELFQQLGLMKDFFLLGRGELFLEFIRQVSSTMSKSTVSAREVNQAFQIAARKVLLTDESALDKFYFVVQNKEQLSQDDTERAGEKGRDPVSWDNLNLCYKVSWPLHLLFTKETLDCYNVLFKFLLRVKKVQVDLHHTWMEHIMASKTFQGNLMQSSVSQLRTGLSFLVDNLQYYLQADVLESQFAQMQHTIKKTRDFEKVQQAHALFQSNILSQTFLRINLSMNQGDSKWVNHSIAVPGIPKTETTEKNHVHRSLDRILALSENFCECLRKWNNPLSEDDLKELNEMDYEFSAHVYFLMQLLFSLRSEPCGSHLSQLLLRLDFNRWFSNSSSFVPPNNMNYLSS